MKKTKFIFLQMKIQCGEYQFNSKSVHEIDSRINIDEFGEDYAKDFYGNHSHSEDDSHFFNGGEIAVRCTNSQEITEEEYKILNKFML